MTAYYNDINEDAAAVLHAQIEDGVIPHGVVDTRSIKDVHPNDLIGFTQCHFFAGGGLWPLAARMAGWPDDRPIWTGSCPCQPFSQAGRGAGTDDPRHLWPDLYRLMRARRPPVAMGEQVAGSLGYRWFDGVRIDLAKEDYSSRSVDIPALAVDAPHERNRQYWVAMDDTNVAWERQPQGTVSEFGGRSVYADAGNLVDTAGVGRRERRTEPELRGGRPAPSVSNVLGLADRFGNGQQISSPGGDTTIQRPGGHAHPHRNGSWWADAEWITCHDGKTRRTKPGLPLLVNGFPGRVGLWSIAGNAISPVLAAEVVAAFIDEYGLPERIAA